MKGFIIYEDYRGKEVVEAIKLGEIVYECKSSSEDDIWINKLSGIRMTSTQAYCNKEDTYDFETGALVALMKMCGVEKVVRACNEAFSEDTFKTYATKYERELNTLKKDFDKVRDLKDFYKKNYNERLEEIKSLKEEKDISWKNYQRKIQKKQDRINELERAYTASNDDKAKLVEYYQREIKKLEAENEKLQHGYNNTDMIYYGGRDCGKQHKALVALFKKLDQKKVDAAYKEAYNITLPVWQKEVLRQMYEIRKIEASKYITPHVNEWLYKIPTKREEMWENILNVSQDPPVDIKVAKQDIKAFLKELQDKIPKARWNGSDCLLTEYTNPYWFKHDYIYFALFRYVGKGNLKICYDENPHSWINKPVIEYIAPMRWDLFKKGRIAVKVNYNNYKEFYEACEKELGKKPSTYPMLWDGVTISICKKDGNFEIFTMEDQKKTGRKIVNWEDVR